MSPGIVQSAVAPIVKKVIPRQVRHWAKDMLNARRVRRSPGRMVQGGRLLLGWNTDRVEDPLTFDFVLSCFVGDASIARGARYAVPGAGYVFDFLRRREDPR